jgi:hypothetical protein
VACPSSTFFVRLRIEKKPQGPVSKPTEFDGAFAVTEWVGYSDPFPILGTRESPNAQTARRIVDAYNQRMQELVAHPEKYKEQRAQEIEWWRKNVLEKKGKSVASP